MLVIVVSLTVICFFRPLVDTCSNQAAVREEELCFL